MENTKNNVDDQDIDLDDDFDDFNSGDGVPTTTGFDDSLEHPRTISPDTIKQYLGYVKRLKKAFLKDQGLDVIRSEDVQPTELVDHLFSLAQTYRPKTFINYRCGLLYWLSTLPLSADVHHAQLMLQVGFPKTGYKSHKQGGKPATLYTSRSSRKRTFKRRDFDKVVAELNRRMSAAQKDRRMRERANELLLWLNAGLASGLRPTEWETARWQHKATGMLLVDVAKIKWDASALPSLAGRPKKPAATRVVEIHEEDRLWVEQHMACVARHLKTGSDFKNYYDNNRIYLWGLCKELFPKEDHPPFTLYTLRGQFSANRKRYKTLKDVAAEMGSSEHVSGTYYGKPKYAHASAQQIKLKQDQSHAPKTKFNFTRSKAT